MRAHCTNPCCAPRRERRRGNTWFLAVLNGPNARTLTVPLSFLGDGIYRTLVVRDRKGEPAAVQVENAMHKRGDSVIVEGYIAYVD